MYLYGYTCTQIAATLTQLGRTTKKGNTNWSAASILGILKNERHCGDLVSRKTYTPSYLDHKLSALKAQHPDIYDEFIETTEWRTFKLTKSQN